MAQSRAVLGVSVGLGDKYTIDIILRARPGHPEDGKLVLVIVDAIPQDEVTRFGQLVEKLRAYVSYVQHDEGPKRDGIEPSEVRIYIVCPAENPPTPSMREIQHVRPHGRADQAIPVAFKTLNQDFP